jgi:hypothetical protein
LPLSIWLDNLCREACSYLYINYCTELIVFLDEIVCYFRVWAISRLYERKKARFCPRTKISQNQALARQYILANVTHSYEINIKKEPIQIIITSSIHVFDLRTNKCWSWMYVLTNIIMTLLTSARINLFSTYSLCFYAKVRCH